ncbi:hypothetical protein DDB_G0283815 [Dictyostelium discoideum AX4]|uniref:peptidylprolyl isomerase n=1 Tax=Dictyostelium discoideum TaxID=44689 RepID=Q54QI6_DICDI|nr:hypothetical protein DDB_G0283815 [Dictyostelium discoideum AX4]EAL65522.1 hypothetical protein DDB_G0283815 [Dictyostelium discoideum AX4]|eukprot:XP_638885.1 hypothetical protein DDB_G0283815 [Dictyostelium discoideum AX4]
MNSSKRFIPKKETSTSTTTTTTTTSTEITKNIDLNKTEKIQITSDNGITKIINKNGIGNNFPFDGDQIYIKYFGKTIDGTIFEDNRNKSSYSFILGGLGEPIKAFNYAIKSMKKGEISTFTIRSKYAFGAIGNGDSVPPNSTVIYEIELISFSNSSDISIEKDGSIIKKILNNSTTNTTNTNTIGTIPKYEAKISIDFKIKTKELNEIIQDKKNYIFKIGSDIMVLDIIEFILMTMQIGEFCQVEVEWSTFLNSIKKWPLDSLDNNLSYIKKFKDLINSQSQLQQQPIIIEIKLNEIIEFDKEKYQYNLNELESIGLNKKEEGTELFKRKYYEMARLKYKRALAFFNSNDSNSKQHIISCLSNQSVCNLLMKQYKQVIELTTQVLQLDPNHIKSLNSRSKALRETGKLNLAFYDIQKALKIDSHNKDTLNELSILNKLKENKN